MQNRLQVLWNQMKIEIVHKCVETSCSFGNRFATRLQVCNWLNKLEHECLQIARHSFESESEGNSTCENIEYS